MDERQTDGQGDVPGWDACLGERPDGVSVALKVKPGAKRARLSVVAHVLRAEVRAPASEGRANAAVIELLAEAFDCPRGRVELLRGERDSRKVLLLRGMSMPGARAALARVLAT